MTEINQAVEWRETFQQPFMDGGEFYVPKKFADTFKMQAGLIKEESVEFEEAAGAWLACSKNRISDEAAFNLKIEVLKELCDIVFVCGQMAAFLKIDLKTAMDRIFESNMTKLDDNCSPIFREDGKIMKGPNYIPPFLDDLV